MKYDYIFKLNCVELYRNGQWSETPEGIGQKILEKGLLHGSKSLTYMEWMLENILPLTPSILQKKDTL